MKYRNKALGATLVAGVLLFATMATARALVDEAVSSDVPGNYIAGESGTGAGQDTAAGQAASTPGGRAAAGAESLQANSEGALLAALGEITGEGTILITGSFPITNTITIQQGQTVTLRGANANHSITTQGSQPIRHLQVEGSLTLANLTLDGQDKDGGIGVSSGTLALHEDARITRCKTEYYGGAVVLTNNSTMHMYGGEISHNQTNLSGTAHGGGVSVRSSTFTLHGGRIQHNASVWGGGVGIVGTGRFTMNGGFINNNATSIEGGGGVMVDEQGSFVLNTGTIEHNSTAGQGQGGGVFVGAGTSGPAKPSFTQNGGAIQYNTAYVGGGVAATWYSDVEIKAGQISNNKAQAGGGISVVDTYDIMQLRLLGGEISHNQALSSAGGGIYANTAQLLTIRIGDGQTNPIIQDNTAQGGGGGIALYQQASAEMYSGTVHNNKSLSGGGGFMVNQNASLTMQGGTISSNQASNGGGIAAFGSAANASLSGGSLSGNQATNGGGIYASTTGLTLVDMNISGNTAQNGAGIHITSGGAATLRGNTLLQGNNASKNGGAIYTGAYDYSDPVSMLGYQNITLEATVIFTGNTAAQAYLPPPNAGQLANLLYAQTSIAKSPGWLHPLNNYDINYEGTPAPAIVAVAYHANGGTGGTTRSELQGEKHIVLTHTQAGVARDGYTFTGWNTAQNGSGTGYAAGGDFTLQAGITLYAQWQANQATTSPGAGPPSSVVSTTSPGSVTTSAGAVTTSTGAVTTSTGAATTSTGAVTTSSGTVTPPPPAGAAPPPSSSSSSRRTSWRASSSTVSSAARQSSGSQASPAASSTSVSSVAPAPVSEGAASPRQGQNTFGVGGFTAQGVWSLLNLVLSLLALLGAAFSLLCLLRKGANGKQAEGRHKSRLWPVALVLGILPIILFLTLERTSLPMALLSRWSPLLLLLFLAHLAALVLAVLGSRRR